MFRWPLVVMFACLLAGFAPQAKAADTVLTRGLIGEPPTLDPQKITLNLEIQVLNDLFETLLSADPAGRVGPALAERWDVSADGLRYTFHLRPDARWSDGKPVTADDVVFGWRRLMDPATAAAYAYAFWPVLNAQAVSEGRLPPAALGVRAIDDRTVEIAMERPAAFAESLFAQIATAPVRRESIGPDGTLRATPAGLISNGPYRLVEKLAQSHIALARNEHFHGADRVAIPRVTYRIVENEDAQMRMFRAGELQTTDRVPLTQVEWARTNLAASYREGQLYATLYLALNLTREPWAGNPDLRRALDLAIDREALATRVGRGDPASTYVTRVEVAGYRPEPPPWATLPKADREALARDHLSKAGYGPERPPPEVEILFSNVLERRMLAIAIAAMWKEVLGIRVRLNNQESRVASSLANRREYPDAVIFGWYADYADPNTFLETMRSTVGPFNRPGWADPMYDATLDRANATRDPWERGKLLAEAEARLLAAHALLPLIHPRGRYLVNPEVDGFIPPITDIAPSWPLSLRDAPNTPTQTR